MKWEFFFPLSKPRGFFGYLQSFVSNPGAVVSPLRGNVLFIAFFDGIPLSNFFNQTSLLKFHLPAEAAP